PFSARSPLPRALIGEPRKAARRRARIRAHLRAADDGADHLRRDAGHRSAASRRRKDIGFAPSTNNDFAIWRNALQSPSKRASGVSVAAPHGPLMQPLSP